MRFIYRLVFALSLALGVSAQSFAQGLIRDAEAEIMMERYADPLIQAAGLNPDSVDLYLIGDMEFNAFVTGGQNIFMHTGAIVIADQPIEIKGVLAHEIGHIDGAHLARFGDASRGALATMAMTVGLGLAAALAGEGGAGAAIMASGSQFATLDMLRYTRAQEAAADQAAANYLEATGQSGRGLVATFERFRYQEVMSRQRQMEYFRSHPLSADRIGALRRSVDNSPYVDVTDTPEEVDELRRVQAKIIGFMVPPAQTFNRYPESDTSIPARYARSVAYFKRGDLDHARAELQTLMDEEPENPFFRELEGQMLYESGFIAESIAPYERAVELMPDSPLLRIGLATSLIAAGSTEQLESAKAHLRFALTEEPQNSLGWYQLSIAHQALGEQALAELATAERAFSVGNNVEAYQFATRAHESLESGTPAWVRAAELKAVAQPSPDEIREWNRNQRQRQPLAPSRGLR
ncbi:M48 family metalloprotease [Marinicauda sp. Alg238-R41]|uniref:M48 family metalloprotease n=1 Tax=Marinicauda sp. Alg238-R41 TaxID=2993447 RepID=UPI0022DF1B10|nr:M48 family metalloprotease [Marinicauda sp. Alg238-R41]